MEQGETFYSAIYCPAANVVLSYLRKHHWDTWKITNNVKVRKWVPYVFNFEKSSLYVKDMNEGSVDFNSVEYIKLHDTTACVTQQPKVSLIKAMVEELERIYNSDVKNVKR